MTTTEILRQTNHRKEALPKVDWRFYQEWNDVVFLHWKVDKKDLEPFIPEEMEIDEINGNAWVSIVIFKMEHIRPRFLPAVSRVSNFDEINIRTYVKYNDRPGVYFLSIEAGNKFACQVAELISDLPYRFADMKRTDDVMICSHEEVGDRLHIRYQPGGKIKRKTELDEWLTERYFLFHDSDTAIITYELHHLPWNLQKMELNQLKGNFHPVNHLLNDAPDLCHYSSGIQVLAWSKRRYARKWMVL